MATGHNGNNGKARPASPDDGIPAGDSPPPPRWHLPAAAVVWGGWLVFLVGMAVHRVVTAPR